MIWNTVGKDVHQARVAGGFIHVMKVGTKVWSVTLNGRVIGSAVTADEGKVLAVNHIN